MTEDMLFDEAIGRAADANEIAAVTNWTAAIEPAVTAEFGVRTECTKGALALFVPATGTAFFNRVLGLGVKEEATRRQVQELVREYTRLGVTFVIHLAPYARPAELALWLAEEGLRLESNWLIMRRDPVLPPPKDSASPFRVVTAVKADAEIFARTLCAGYGMPDDWAPLYQGFVGRERWQHLLAFDGNQAIGTSCLFADDGNVWMGNSATLPQYRKRGVQTMLNAQRLRLIQTMPCSTVTGETWEPTEQRPNQSLRNHLRDGWVRAYVRRNYSSSPFVRA
jgi:hypothetical protein